MTRVVVTQDPEQEIAIEVLATEIAAISAGIKKLRAGRMNDRALLLLIQHAAPSVGRMSNKVGIAEIKAVLAGLEDLEATYLKKKPAAEARPKVK